MRRWADFEESAPELALLARRRIEGFGFVFLGTLRADGGPRVNPVEAHLVGGDLALSLIPTSLKARDLHRDPRAYLHTAVVSREVDVGEFKLRCRAAPVEERDARAAIADAVERRHGWRPGEDWAFFGLGVEGAAFHRYDEAAAAHVVTRWTPDRGVESSSRTYL